MLNKQKQEAEICIAAKNRRNSSTFTLEQRTLDVLFFVFKKQPKTLFKAGT